MKPYRNILTTTDFSDPSQLGLNEAARLAKELRAQVTVLTVVEPLIMATPPAGSLASKLPALQAEQETLAQDRLSQTIKRHFPADVLTTGLVMKGDVADTILRIAEEKHVDLIVMATHGRSGWRRLLFGSVAEKVLRQADRPVLTVRGGTASRP